MNDTEFDVAAVGDLADGEMKRLAAGETIILLACVEGSYYAVGATCPHVAEAMRLDRLPSPDVVRRGGVDWLELVKA